MKLFGLIGNPVKHSLSPKMYNRALKELGVCGTYVKKKVVKQDLSSVVKGAQLFGFRGLNITIPHKEAVVDECDFLSEEAKDAEAVNTIKFEEGKIKGYNTDVFGAREVISKRLNIEDCDVTVLGAGGAAKGVCVALKDAEKIYLANRTKQKAIDLASTLKKKLEINIQANELNEVNSLIEKSNLLINATSVGMEENKSIPNKKDLKKDLVVFDLVYKPVETKLLKMANEIGCKTISGLEMLVEQGAQSLEIWINKKAPRKEMTEAIQEKP